MIDCYCGKTECASYAACHKVSDRRFGLMATCCKCQKRTWVRVDLDLDCEEKESNKFSVLECPSCKWRTPVIGPGSVRASLRMQKSGKVRRIFVRTLPSLFSKEGKDDVYMEAKGWSSNLKFDDWDLDWVQTVLQCLGDPIATQRKCKCGRMAVMFVLDTDRKRRLCKEGWPCGVSLTCIGKVSKRLTIRICPACNRTHMQWFL